MSKDEADKKTSESAVYTSHAKKNIDQPTTSLKATDAPLPKFELYSGYDTLEKVLTDKILSKKFRVFLKKQKCKESLDFYLASVEYKRADEKKRKIMAKKIYDSFLGGSVRNGVNITAHNLKTIQAHLEDPDVNIFDNAASEVATMLNHDKALQFSARLRAGEDFSLDTGDQEPFCSNRNSVMIDQTNNPGYKSTEPCYILVTESETESVKLNDPMQTVGQAADDAARRFLQKVSDQHECALDSKDYEFVDEEGNTPDPSSQAVNELAGRTLRLVETIRFVAQVFRHPDEIRTYILRARKCLSLFAALRPLKDRYGFPNSVSIFISNRKLHRRLAVGELGDRSVAICGPGLEDHVERLLASGELARLKAFDVMNKKLSFLQHRETGICEVRLSHPVQASRKLLLRHFGHRQ
ncbi:unnamed protein product [Enterobius vermicularis]|uniref:RGS domain-containing protein n=1 Tax=Enterobius vermicularis TaxID=51028 RepID=A0A158Q9W0_ENTVE|nr:unnamed protein product [Enterobius vermicularis]